MNSRNVDNSTSNENLKRYIKAVRGFEKSENDISESEGPEENQLSEQSQFVETHSNLRGRINRTRDQTSFATTNCDLVNSTFARDQHTTINDNNQTQFPQHSTVMMDDYVDKIPSLATMNKTIIKKIIKKKVVRKKKRRPNQVVDEQLSYREQEETKNNPEEQIHSQHQTVRDRSVSKNSQRKRNRRRRMSNDNSRMQSETSQNHILNDISTYQRTFVNQNNEASHEHNLSILSESQQGQPTQQNVNNQQLEFRLNADPSEQASQTAPEEQSPETVAENIRINQLNIDVYIQHRRERQKRINTEINNFLWINFVYMSFFMLVLVKYAWVPDLNCEIGILVFIFHHAFQIFRLRSYFCRGLWQDLESLPQDQRKKEMIRRIRSIVDNFWQILFYILMLFFTIKNDDTRLVRSYIVLIPECFSFLMLILMSRWPDNPCSSLMHLLKCCAMILKFFLIIFILLKIDDIISWSWTTTLWPFWCGLAVHIIFIIFVIGLFLYSIVCFCRGEFSWQCLVANLWAIFICIGFGLSAIYSVLQLIQLSSTSTTDTGIDESTVQKSSVASKIQVNFVMDKELQKFSLIWIPILYFVGNILSTFLLKSLLMIWFEKLLYHDDRIQIHRFQDEQVPLNENENTIKVYKFKAPAFLRKLTNTYFKKSQLRDLRDLKKKINTLKRKYRSKQTNLSFNLEEYLHNKDIEKTRQKDAALPDEDQENQENPINNKNHCMHMSITSDKQLDNLGRRFMSDFPFRKKCTKKRYQTQPKQELTSAVQTKGDLAHSCSTVQLKDCLACMSTMADAVLMPCGHGGLCYECSIHLLKKGGDMQRCHLCREYIEQVLKIDTNTIFKDYIRVIEASQVAFRGHTLSINQFRPRAFDSAISSEVAQTFTDNRRNEDSEQIDERDLEQQDLEVIIRKFNQQYEIRNPMTLFINSQMSSQVSAAGFIKPSNYNSVEFQNVDKNFRFHSRTSSKGNENMSSLQFNDPQQVYFGKNENKPSTFKKKLYNLGEELKSDDDMNSRINNQFFSSNNSYGKKQTHKKQKANLLPKVIEDLSSHHDDSSINLNIISNKNKQTNPIVIKDDVSFYQPDNDDESERSQANPMETIN